MPRDILQGRGPGDLWATGYEDDRPEGEERHVIELAEDVDQNDLYALHDGGGNHVADLTADWDERKVGQMVVDRVDRYRWDDDVMVVRRSVAVALVGFRAEWAEPVVVRLPDPVEEERARCIAIARGCTDYSGGHSGRELHAYRHGMATVAEVLAAPRGDTQAGVVQWLGEHHREIVDLGELVRLRDEARRLERSVAVWREVAETREAERGALRAEVEELRAEVERLTSRYAKCCDALDAERAEVRRLQAEIDSYDDPDPDDEEPYDEWDDRDDEWDHAPNCYGCGVCDRCTEQTAYEMADMYAEELEKLRAENERLRRIAGEVSDE